MNELQTDQVERKQDLPVVYVVDDDTEVCESLQWLLESIGVDVRAFNDPRLFLEAFEYDRPACIICDLRMPFMSGQDVLEALRERGIETPVIILTAYGDVASTARAFRTGAADYLEKPVHDSVLLERVQQLLREEEARQEDARETLEFHGRIKTLSSREMEVARLVVAGQSNKEIARALDISPKTVEIHRANVMRKSGALSVAELVQRFLRANLVS